MSIPLGTEGRTKIVATLGPATDDEATIAGLLRAGVNVVRLNFSHSAHEEDARRFGMVRKIAAELRLPVAILQDLQGPKIRIGALASDAVDLVEGAEFRITTTPIIGTAERVSTTYAELPYDVHPNDRILLDDGLIELRVVGVEGNEVVTTVTHGSALKPHKGINLPGVPISLPALTDKDRTDLAFGVELGVDFVALSFVRRAKDVRMARTLLTRLGATETPLIAKIETPEALEDLPGIIDATEGVMVARGDLGVEISPEQVPSAQKRIIRLANARGKVVITATQLLESMTTNPRPTRAEVSDVFNAIWDGTDAVMLSGETAVGAHPVATVQMMRRIAWQAEAAFPDRADNPTHRRQTASHAIAEAASRLADDTRARALVVFTRSGYTARLVSTVRPHVPVFAVTDNDAVYRQLALWWGLYAVRADFAATTDETIARVERALVGAGLLADGDPIVIVGSSVDMARAHTNLIKLSVVGANQ